MKNTLVFTNITKTIQIINKKTNTYYNLSYKTTINHKKTIK